MKYYVYLDGDDIGDTLNEYLEKEDLISAQNFSKSINKAMYEINEICKEFQGCTVKICGGDDLLIEFIDVGYNYIVNSVKTIQNHFNSITGNTLSGGCGSSLKVMLNNLSFAKKYKNNTFIMKEDYYEISNISNN